MGRTIDLDVAIDALTDYCENKCVNREDAWCSGCHYGVSEYVLKALPSAQPEPLTDKEQRIFFAAMGREEKVCKKVDEEWRYYREAYEDSLVWACKEIVRKVKGALWKT